MHSAGFLSAAPTSDSLKPWGTQDIETIDSLARAINNWDGGLVLVSHDFRLISQVC
jgi:ATP-binding cassette subfamily F protein 2